MPERGQLLLASDAPTKLSAQVWLWLGRAGSGRAFRVLRPRCLVSHVLLIAGLCLPLNLGCLSITNSKQPTSRRDINAVLADHDQELLAMPGVVGVYVGLLPDNKTPCLKIMLARKDPALARRLPRRLEGYPVVTEVTGDIRPMR
jgi:hypothetical protein